VTGALVVAGALVGAPLRLWVTRFAGRRGGDPALGTLAVNVAGSARLGALTGASWVSAAALALVYVSTTLSLGVGAAAAAWALAGGAS